MIDERLLLGEPRGADVALVGPLARVRPHVALHVAARLEPHVALLARVRPLASVPEGRFTLSGMYERKMYMSYGMD